ncbi:MAG TPA: hypothetical protein VK183_04905 [Flavobacterium sp.]|nr:hypothetical protein [Flavobacterium sp.]
MKRKLPSEEFLRKDQLIRKTQFDTVWYFELSDIAAWLGEDLDGVETVVLPIVDEGETVLKKCTSLTDIRRFLRDKGVID